MKDPIATIFARRSVRRFAGDGLTDGDVQQIETILERESAPGPFGSRPRFALASADEMSALGRLGTYGIIRDAPAFVVGAVSRGETAMEDFGYRMEGIILEATALGLGTCWLGGTFNRSAAHRLISLEPDELLPAVTPIGYPSDRPSLIDGAVRLVARSSTRRPFEELFFDGSFERPLSADDAGKWREILECVRRGPSASNKQPWRIVLHREPEGDLLSLYFAENRLYNAALGEVRIQNIDLGIAMRHVAEAAAARRMGGAWSRKRQPGIAPGSSDPEYVATWSASG